MFMLTAPIPATHKVLAKSGLSIDDIDAYEVNEAFAPVPLMWAHEFGADPAKLNPRGGAIALGHALGSSGTRLLTTLRQPPRGHRRTLRPADHVRGRRHGQRHHHRTPLTHTHVSKGHRMIVNDSVALVTGGASGLGLATAKALLADGASVVIVDLPVVQRRGRRQGTRRPRPLRRRRRHRRGRRHRRPRPRPQSLGPLRVSVNCAGIGNAVRTVGKEGAFPLDAFTKVINVNLSAPSTCSGWPPSGSPRPSRSTASAASSSTPPPSPRSTARSARPPTPHRRAASSA